MSIQPKERLWPVRVVGANQVEVLELGATLDARFSKVHMRNGTFQAVAVNDEIMARIESDPFRNFLRVKPATDAPFPKEPIARLDWAGKKRAH